jgi:predicted nuclease of predicted toxin-antitoxin system
MRSKKRSAASSSVKPRERPTFFVDRSLGGKIVPEALRDAGASVVALGALFPPDAKDEEWLARCGVEGWVVLTRDKRLRYRPAEIAALRESGCLVFVLTAGEMTGPSMAEVLTRHLARMTEIAMTAERPAIYRITAAGMIKSA